MKLRKNEQGFTALEILLTLIFVAIVVFIGYYIAHVQKNKTDDSKASASTSAVTNSMQANANSPKLADAKSLAVAAGNEGKATLTFWSDSYMQGEFTSGFQAKIDQDGVGGGCTAMSDSDYDSFTASDATISGDTAHVALRQVSSSDPTATWSSHPLVTLTYTDGSWLISDWTCS